MTCQINTDFLDDKCHIVYLKLITCLEAEEVLFTLTLLASCRRSSRKEDSGRLVVNLVASGLVRLRIFWKIWGYVYRQETRTESKIFHPKTWPSMTLHSGSDRILQEYISK